MILAKFWKGNDDGDTVVKTVFRYMLGFRVVWLRILKYSLYMYSGSQVSRMR